MNHNHGILAAAAANGETHPTTREGSNQTMLTSEQDRNAWRHQAACRPDLHPTIPVDELVAHWFGPDDTGGPSDWARATCAGCPVIAECVDDAIRMGDEHGLRGGLGEPQLRPLRAVLAATHPEGGHHFYGPGCGCDYCARLREFTHPVPPDRPRNVNGAGAQCGLIATYRRGCRCHACSLAAARRDRHARIEHLAKAA